MYYVPSRKISNELKILWKKIIPIQHKILLYIELEQILEITIWLAPL